MDAYPHTQNHNGGISMRHVYPSTLRQYCNIGGLWRDCFRTASGLLSEVYCFETMPALRAEHLLIAVLACLPCITGFAATLKSPLGLLNYNLGSSTFVSKAKSFSHGRAFVAQNRGASVHCSLQKEWEDFVVEIQKDIISKAEAADGKVLNSRQKEKSCKIACREKRIDTCLVFVQSCTISSASSVIYALRQGHDR